MKTLKNVFQIIDLVKANKEMKLQEIADSLGLYKSTAYRLTKELCDYGYVRKNPQTKTYQLGLKFVDVASQIIDNMDLRELAKTGISELNKITQETIHLAVLVDTQVVYVDKKESNHTIRMYSHIGKAAPLYCTGVGKAILAFQTPEMIDSLLASVRFAKFTSTTIPSKAALLRELATIRREGCAFDREEHEPHIGCIAAPLRDFTGNVVASVSITAVMYPLRMEQLVSYKSTLLRVCREISRNLGYREERPAQLRTAIRKRSAAHE